MTDSPERDSSAGTDRRGYLQRLAGAAVGTATFGTAALGGQGQSGRDTVGVAAAAEFPQADADGSAIGGGDAYGNTVTESDATTVVSSRSGLVDALGSAGSGDVVFVDGGATVDMTGVSDVTIPAGVTLASDRGVGGATGGEIRTDEYSGYLFVAGKGARVTGLRLRGPHVGWLEVGDGDDIWNYSSYGVRATGSDVEVDNVRLFGFPIAGVRFEASGGHVHHNTIVDNAGDGMGYGVQVSSGDALVEFNYFERNRHSVVTYSDDYVARYNVHGPEDAGSGNHLFDVHDPGGGRVVVHHNTFECTEVTAVEFNAGPSERGVVAHNWFHHDAQPSGCGGNPQAWNLEGDACDTVEVFDNHYGTDEPAASVGAPRNSGDGGGGGGGPTTKRLVVVPQGTVTNYTLEVDGSVTAVTNVDHDAGDADTVTQHDDGTVTVEGATGENSGDTWDVTGTVTGFSADQPTSVTYDGQSVDAASLGRFVLVPEGNVTYYTLEVDGSVTAVTDVEHDAGDADTVTRHDDGTTTVEGATGENSGDTWDLGGEITGFSTDQPVTTTLGGLSVDPDSLGSG